MKRKYLILATCASCMIALASMSPEGEVPLSSGAPVGSTNAPGEESCGKAGCHTGDAGAANINTGNGILNINCLQDISSYVPGATYDIVVSIEEAGVQRFGFSFTALDENNKKAGTLIVADEQRTQIFKGSLQYSDRDYMTYRMAGTNPYAAGRGQWAFKWKAPDMPMGKITFYAAAISGNDDATDNGDLVYTQTISSQAYGLGLNTPGSTTTVTVFPNPAKDVIHIQFGGVQGSVSFIMYDVTGKQINIPGNKITTGGSEATIPVYGLQAGVYYLSVKTGEITETKKILLIN